MHRRPRRRLNEENNMSVAEAYTASPRFEPMRIAGRKVEADGVIEVRYP